jgi:hypothetical protein
MNTYNNPSLLVSLKQARPYHYNDMKFTLGRAIRNFSILQELPKRPEYLLETTIECILMCQGALLDATKSKDKDSSMDSDIFIQFGICYALGQRVQFIAVKTDDFEELPPHIPIVESYLEIFEGHWQLEAQLANKIKTWSSAKTFPKSPVIKRDPTNGDSFLVIGVQGIEKRDLLNAIQSFAQGVNWKLKANFEIKSSFQMDDLMREIAVHSFAVFCIGQRNNEETLIAIGLAMGMGVPFLVLQHEEASLPDILKGYNGVITYQGFNDLPDKLKTH